MDFRMTYCFSILINLLMVKSRSKRKQTYLGTGDGLMQVKGLNGTGTSRSNINLNNEIGEITIRNIKGDQSGDFEVEINTTIVSIHRKLSINISAVVVVEVSVMEGDSVTLNINYTVQKDEELNWKVKPKDENKYKSINDERFKESKTGSLTITNINVKDCGLYRLESSSSTSSDIKYKAIFNVTVHDGVKTVSVKEGELVILHTGVTEIQGYDRISWKKEDYLVAEFNQQTKLFLRRDRNNRFNGRLQLHPQNGYIIISDSETTDSGVYHLDMSSSSHNLQRTISVRVKDSGSSAAVSGICGASFGLVIWAVTVLLLEEV